MGKTQSCECPKKCNATDKHFCTCFFDPKNCLAGENHKCLCNITTTQCIAETHKYCVCPENCSKKKHKCICETSNPLICKALKHTNNCICK